MKDWSSWLKIITRLILWDYLHIYSVHGVCQRNVLRSFHYLQLMELLANYGRLPHFTVLPRSVLFVSLIRTSVIIVTQIVISAILNYFDLLFSPFYYLIFHFIRA